MLHISNLLLAQSKEDHYVGGWESVCGIIWYRITTGCVCCIEAHNSLVVGSLTCWVLNGLVVLWSACRLQLMLSLSFFYYYDDDDDGDRKICMWNNMLLTYMYEFDYTAPVMKESEGREGVLGEL